MRYKPENNYKWIEHLVDDSGGCRGQVMYVPELRLNLYVVKHNNKWVGVAKFAYNENKTNHTTKPHDNIDIAKSKLVNKLIGGLRKCEKDLLDTIQEE